MSGDAVEAEERAGNERRRTHRDDRKAAGAAASHLRRGVIAGCEFTARIATGDLKAYGDARNWGASGECLELFSR